MTIPRVQTQLADPKEHLRSVSAAVNRLLAGEYNASGTLTLHADETETIVTTAMATLGARVVLFPASQSASDATGVWAESADGSFTVHHDANSATDRAFAWVLFL